MCLLSFKFFNPTQTQLFHVLYHTHKPVLCCALTGSGKTMIAEIALLRMKNMQEVEQKEQKQKHASHYDKNKHKCTCVTPKKILLLLLLNCM